MPNTGLSTTEISHVLKEVEDAVLHGWIQKVSQPSTQTIVLDIRQPGRTFRLLLCSKPERARLHLLSRPISNPPSPPSFCQFLRAHIQGARIDRIQQIAQDRIVCLRLSAKEGLRTLLCEMTARRNDMYVLDGAECILRALSGDRTVLGHVYEAPKLAESTIRAQSGSRFSDPDPGNLSPFPISMAIERYYQIESDACAVDDVKAARVKAIKQSIKKERRRIDAWEGDLLKMSAYQGYARYGELVKANLSSIRKGMDQVTLIDYFDPSMPEISIPLDEAMSAQGNMDEYFRKHRKYETAEREIRPRIQRAQRLLADLLRELSAIEQGTWAAPSSDLGRQPKHVASRTFKQRQTRSEPFRRFMSADGLSILVGRNARENDDLTFGLARSDDLWLHARGIPGSHVIVRLDKGKDVPTETLQDAATLALCYSDLRKSGKGEVIYTRRKWVKKAKGQAPGAVTVTQERSLNVSLDKSRLEALKARTTQIP